MLAHKVSIVLPTYNQATFLPLAINGIVSQIRTDWELIIVNTGSADSTKEYLDTLSDPRISIIHRDNAGLASALNHGFALATGEYRTWTSAEDVAAPTWLEKLVASLDAAPASVGCVSSGYAEIDKSGQVLGFKRGQNIEYDRMVACNAGIASFIYRASIAEHVGEYDTTLTGAEDWDMWLRILDVCDGLYVDDILYYHRLHDDNMTSAMRAKIDTASVAVVHKLYHRHGDSFNLNRIYPRLALANNPELATWQAKTRLAAILMSSPFCPPAWAAILLLDALHARFSPEVHRNLVLLLCRCNAWDMAVQAVDDFRNFTSSSASDALRKRLVNRDMSISQEFSIFHAPDDSLVFDLGRGGNQKVYDVNDLVVTPMNHAPAQTPGYSFCIITNGKRPEKLEREIDSIFALNIPDFEILVGGEPPADFSRHGVRVLNASDAARNGRLGEMRNVLCRQARFEHLIVADDDMIFHPDFYTGLLAYGKDFDVLCVRLLNPDGTRHWDWATVGGPTGHHLLPYDAVDPHVYVTGGLCVMKAAVFKQVQWDEGRGFYQGEDVDFSSRLKKAGMRIQFCSGSTVTHDDPAYSQVGHVIVRRTIVENAKAQGIKVASTTMDTQSNKIGLAEFVFSDSNEIIACPEGKNPLRTKSGKQGGKIVHFNKAVCDFCPRLPDCPVKHDKLNSTISYDTKALRLARRRLQEKTETNR